MTFRKWLLGSMTFAALALGGACGDDGGDDGGTPDAANNGTPDAAAGNPDAEQLCAGGTDLTYDNFGQNFMDTYCQSCHGSQSTQRFGAPSSVTFDNLAQVMMWAPRIKARAGVGSSMPSRNPRPEQAERDDLVEWIDCGTPN